MTNYKAKIYHLYESEETFMNFLDKLERKYGRFCIPNLMLYIMLGQGSILLITMLQPRLALTLYQYLGFNPYLIAHGQIWRLFSYVFIPSTSSLWSMLFAVLFYTYVGRMLEHSWGTFKLNFYYLSGMLFNIIGIFILQVLLYRNTAQVDYYYLIHSAQITYYLNLSLFLAYAAIYPELEVLLFYILPIKVKYLAYIDVAFLILQFIQGDLTSRVLLIISLLNFLLYFSSRLLGRGHLTQTQRNFRKAQKGYAKRELKKGPPIAAAFHKCTVCGKTELTDPDMEFRYCSKCNGNYEYCMDHLHNHEHIQ